MNIRQEPVRLPGEPPSRHCMVVHAHYPLGETRVERESLALLQRGHTVDVICLRAPGEQPCETVGGVTVHRLPVRRNKERGAAAQLVEYVTFLILAMIRLTRLNLRAPYHVVQVHNLPDFLVFAALPVRLMGVRVILDIHDLMPEFFGARFGRSFDSWPVRLIRFQERLACRFADAVIVVSEHWRRTLIGRGVPADKCNVVMNVADEAIFHPAAIASPRLRDPNGLRLIYHGTLTRRYGLDLAIRAVARVRDDIPGIHLTLLGDGDAVEELQALIEELDLGQHVELIHELRSTAELPAIIGTADLGIAPYRNDPFTDGLLPTKLMEYAALGMPAVAARTTAIESTFGSTMVALFAPGDIDDLTNCLLALHRDPARLVALRAGAARFNERYNWSEIGAAYVALVEWVGRGKKGAPPLPTQQRGYRAEFSD